MALTILTAHYTDGSGNRVLGVFDEAGLGEAYRKAKRSGEMDHMELLETIVEVNEFVNRDIKFF